MAYGVVQHLWIHGEPGPDGATIRSWVDEAFPKTYLARIGYQRQEVVVDSYRFGPNLTLVDLQELGGLKKVKPVAQLSPSTEEVELLDAVAESAVQAGFDCTMISMGDVGSMAWKVETLGKSRRGARMDPAEESDQVAEDEFEVFRTLAPSGEWNQDGGSPELARQLVRKIIDLPLKEVYHYIDWSYSARETIEKREPVEGFASVSISQALPTLTLVWKAKRLPHPMSDEEMGPVRKKGKRVQQAESVLGSLLVWGFVLGVAVAVPAVLYHFIFSPPSQLKPALVLVAIITFFWGLFSLVDFLSLRWRVRAAIMVGGELLMACFMWLIHGAQLL